MPLRKKTLIVGVLFALLFIGGCAFTVYYLFFLRFVRVPTGAMMNTIIPGDQLVIHKAFGQIERGEIVVFQYPEDSTYYINRVIGLPGETIQVRGNIVYINDRPLDEQRVMAEEDSLDINPLKENSTEGQGPYRVFFTEHDQPLPSEVSGDFGTNTPFRIPNDFFFVMGDYRDNSQDSRHMGPVPRELIWGRPSLIYYSEAMTSEGGIRWERIFKKVR